VYPRQVGDVNGDGRDDIVGFGEAGVYVSLGTTAGTFGTPAFALANFARGAGGWSSNNTYPREVADVNGDGRDDIVGFGEAGVYVSLGTTAGTFGTPTFALANFARGAGGWSSNDVYPRDVEDVNGDGRADIVGYGEAGVYVSFGTSSGGFEQPIFTIQNFARGAGGWTSENLYPREVGDVNGDGLGDIVGFGEAGAWVSPGHFTFDFA
jgi:hypothetical protein